MSVKWTGGDREWDWIVGHSTTRVCVIRFFFFFLQSSPFVLVRHSIISWRLQVYRRSAYSKCRYQNIAGPDYNNDNNRKASGESDFFFYQNGSFPKLNERRIRGETRNGLRRTPSKFFVRFGVKIFSKPLLSLPQDT